MTRNRFSPASKPGTRRSPEKRKPRSSSQPGKLAISPRAALDLEQIGDYIARDNPSRAISFVAEIQQVCKKIARRPVAFPARDELAAGIGVAVHGNYLILFRISDKNVRVERVLHGARNLGTIAL